MSNAPKATGTPVTNGGADRTPMIIVGAVIAVVVVIALAVFLWPSDDGGGDEGTGANAAANAIQENAPVVISGEDLPFLSGADEAIGFPSPSVTGQSFDGSEVVIDADDGTPKVLVFLAHWCPACQSEVPQVQSWLDEGGLPEGTRMIGIATSVDAGRANYPPSRWLAQAGWTPEILLDDTAHSVSAAFGMSGTPFFVFIDANGNIAQRVSGGMEVADIEAALQAMLDGAALSDVETDGGTPTDITDEELEELIGSAPEASEGEGDNP